MIDKQTKINNIENKELVLCIGLNTNEGGKLEKKEVLKVISQEFIKKGISGFNVTSINGFWENKQEKSVLISFFNTFKVNYSDITDLIGLFKTKFKQDAILLEILNTPFEFL